LRSWTNHFGLLLFDGELRVCRLRPVTAVATAEVSAPWKANAAIAIKYATVISGDFSGHRCGRMAAAATRCLSMYLYLQGHLHDHDHHGLPQRLLHPRTSIVGDLLRESCLPYSSCPLAKSPEPISVYISYCDGIVNCRAHLKALNMEVVGDQPTDSRESSFGGWTDIRLLELQD
jgi:hypothetical protein